MSGTFEPLRRAAFRRIWLASLFCNVGQQIMVVTATWVMVQLTDAPERVALVQTASLLPVMLLALPGGALADIRDRRKTAITALLLTFSGALAQAVLSLTGLLNPALILICCFITGTGIAFFSPAWQASVIELVGAKSLPAGVALNSMSNNLARSVGPAIGGFAVAAFGASAGFGLNVLLYLPMLIALYLWRRAYERPKLPPENLSWAALSGLRYAVYSPHVRGVLMRATVSALSTSAVYSLLPLLAVSVLAGNAGTYGLLLGALGAGAVTAALFADVLRGHLAPERSVRIYSITQGVAVLVLALSPFMMVSAFALFVTGACWVTNNATYNVNIQLSSPRWVAGRLLALFQASISGGLAIGSGLWGHFASATSVPHALLAGGSLMLLSPLLGIYARLPPRAETETLSVPSPRSPEVRMSLSGRSGPIVIEVRYRIPEERATEFYGLMQQVRRSHERNGAYGFSLVRDVADPEVWREMFRFPTWHDYVRARDRPTAAERELQSMARMLHDGPDSVHISRLLEYVGGTAPEAQDVADYRS